MGPFTNITDISGQFTETELDSGVDFVETGDQGQIITTDTTGWGDDYGDDWGGGTQTVTISGASTSWTDIETP